MGTTGGAFKLPVQHLALLLAPEDTVMTTTRMMARINRTMSRRRAGVMMPTKMIRVTVKVRAMTDVGVSDELVTSGNQQSGTFSTAFKIYIYFST